jgi:hypothetical protein
MEYAQQFIEKNDPAVELENAIDEARRAAAAADFTSAEEDYEELSTDAED